MDTKADLDLIEGAASVMQKAARQDVIRLAHFASDIALRNDFIEIADAATQVEKTASSAQFSLQPAMARLYDAISSAQSREYASARLLTHPV